MIRFVNIDFDDCGRSPFVLDYVRYIAAIKAQCIEMRTKQLLRAYLAGLRGKALKPPQKVRALMKMNVDAYDALADNYMAKNTSNRKFKPKPGAIEAYRGKVKRTSIAKLFPGESLLDLAHRIEERGGSVDEARIWALVEAPDSHIRIMEIKGYAKPGTANYMGQPAVDKWLGDIRSAFWPGLTGAEYDLIILEGKRYWLRQKRVALINVPYSSQKKQEIDLVIALAIFDANILGLAHGRQTAAAEYTRAIRKNPAKFHRATKKLERVYLAYAKREMKKRQRAASAGGS